MNGAASNSRDAAAEPAPERDPGFDANPTDTLSMHFAAR
jgi:hypothetical protein